MELWVGAINLGLLYAFMAMGVYITFRVFDFADITVDGSFVTGAAVSAVLTVAGVHPAIALGLSFLAGACAGTVTAIIHTRFNINGLLAGILVMTGLYSVNLHIMGRSNIPLLDQPGIMTALKELNPGLPYEVWLLIVFAFIILLFWWLISLFFKTDLGLAMRATGNNASMAGASGLNINMVKTMGMAMANGFVAISGSLVAQYQGFADIGMGIGSIVFGLAAVIIGESVLKTRSIYGKVLSVITGSILFRLMVAFALWVGLNPLDLKLITAAFVLLILIMPKVFPALGFKGFTVVRQKHAKRLPVRKIALGVVAVLSLTIVVSGGYWLLRSNLLLGGKEITIGLVQLGDDPPLDITRVSFMEEMKRLGYEEDRNIRIYTENAHGDAATVNSIVDKFLNKKVDIIVPISTVCVQAAVNKIKKKPIIFATIASPFVLGLGRSDSDHLPNVTGVYGTAPVDKLLELATAVLPGKMKVGSMWDPSQANSVFNLEKLKEAMARNRNTVFKGATVGNTSEVYQAALGLVNSGIDAFVFSTDHVVFSAFESVVKAARTKKVPIFITDVERLKDGALAAYGYDYSHSGIQAARLTDRIIKGEKPAAIPFEQYKKVTIGLNLNTARELGITIPGDLLTRATTIIDDEKKDKRPKRLALFVFSDSYIMKFFTDGVLDQLNRSGILKEYNVTVDMQNAHNDYGTAQAIVQDIVRQKYDYMITGSTLSLQVAAKGNRKIPHIFGAVTDPYRMGIAKNHKDHISNITGIATFQPVESAMKAMRAIFPKAKRVGILWNPSEANSEACVLKARETARRLDFELVEMNVSTPDEVKDTLSAVLNKKIDIFFASGDNTMALALVSVAGILKERKIPFFTNDPSDIDRGSFFSIGADYFEVGVETAGMAKRVIKGEDIGKIPIRDVVPEKIAVNLDLARQYGVVIPESILHRAAVVEGKR